VPLRLGEFIARLGGDLRGDANLEIRKLAPLSSAGPHELSFLSQSRYRQQLIDTCAGAVIVSEEHVDLLPDGVCAIVHPQPYLYFARSTRLWREFHPVVRSHRIHPSAVIDPAAQIADDAVIGPCCVVENGVVIGPQTILHSHVTVGHDCRIGSRCIVHPGVVIGADGFGFASHEGGWEKIEQLGAVSIGDDVEIGANTCIDRGALEDTVIGTGVKLDNLIQIGHNVQVGDHTAMAGCVGVAGSARIGAGCTVGGGAVVLGHLSLVDGVHISAASVVTRSISQPGHYTGMFPIDENAQWEKNAASLKQLARLRERVRQLEQQIQTLQKEKP
jgi:UDP-3-O-[3-hydroxymyristoyl] glucosamine N-acyltransferase